MRYLRLPFAIAVFLLSAGNQARADSAQLASPPASGPNAVLAKLGGVEIRESDFDRWLRDGRSAEEIAEVQTNPVARQEALEAYLDLEVLAAKARQDGVDKSPIFQKARELMEMKILVKLVSERERERLSKAGSVIDQELRDYYDQHTNLFQVPPCFTARQILVYVKGNPAFPDKVLDDADAQAKVHEALARLRRGETWEGVAKTFSDDSATNQRGGLLADARFGYFAPEVESAVRQQELGKPGDIVKSQFGYHVLQVERRTPEGERAPFEQVREIIASRISAEKSSAAQRAYLDPIRAEVGLKETPAASSDLPLLDVGAIKADEVLATLGGKPIREADFQWFLKDAFRPEQRTYVFSRPGARQELLRSYLDMRVLEAKARKEGLDQDPDFAAARDLMEMRLLAEFLQERDRVNPWNLPGATEAARMAAQKEYLSRLRSDLGLKESDVRRSE